MKFKIISIICSLFLIGSTALAFQFYKANDQLKTELSKLEDDLNKQKENLVSKDKEIATIKSDNKKLVKENKELDKLKKEINSKSEAMTIEESAPIQQAQTNNTLGPNDPGYFDGVPPNSDRISPEENQRLIEYSNKKENERIAKEKVEQEAKRKEVTDNDLVTHESPD